MIYFYQYELALPSGVFLSSSVGWSVDHSFILFRFLSHSSILSLRIETERAHRRAYSLGQAMNSNSKKNRRTNVDEDGLKDVLSADNHRGRCVCGYIRHTQSHSFRVGHLLFHHLHTIYPASQSIRQFKLAGSLCHFTRNLTFCENG